MSFRTMMVIKAVVCLCFGVAILVAPVFLYSLFDVALDAEGVYAARQYGASLIGILVLTWSGKDALHAKARRVCAGALCVYDALGLVVTLHALLTDVMGPLGWLVAVLYLFLAAGFAYVWFAHEQAN
ncbi:MAG: hypothetical protein GX557_14265 [Chloroflexi bacterium]|nr:hypothetical protein [Chloroflexota bacterium]